MGDMPKYRGVTLSKGDWSNAPTEDSQRYSMLGSCSRHSNFLAIGVCDRDTVDDFRPAREIHICRAGSCNGDVWDTPRLRGNSLDDGA